MSRLEAEVAMAMLRVALTGGLATGKSQCLGRLAAMGVPVIDADILSREILRPGTGGLDEVIAKFGPDVLEADGSLDRHALAGVVFADGAARRDLEAILHPKIFHAIEDWFASLPETTPFAVADVPLLFETGHEGDFDRVIVAACSPAQQLQRALERGGLSEFEALERIAAQLPIETKTAKADYVIDTSGTVEETHRQVVEVWDALKQ